MISICCTPEKDDYNDLNPKQKKRFCFLVYQFRKKGYQLPAAQTRAYSQVLSEEIPIE